MADVWREKELFSGLLPSRHGAIVAAAACGIVVAESTVSLVESFCKT
jgi:hypothetical protein